MKIQILPVHSSGMSSVIQKVHEHIGSCFSYITRSSEVGSSELVQKLSHSLRAPASVQIRSPPSLVDKLSSWSSLPHGYKMCAVPPAVTCILPAESKRSKQGAIVSILEKQKRTTCNFNIPFVGLNRVTSLPLVLRKQVFLIGFIFITHWNQEKGCWEVKLDHLLRHLALFGGCYISLQLFNIV